MGYGHGVDSQDKSAGKATTYALKYALLYAFLVPTGKIDDADNTHSEEISTPKKSEAKVEEIKSKLSTIVNIDDLNAYYGTLSTKTAAITALFSARKIEILKQAIS